MEPKGKDPFIEEVDRELRSIDARLKKVLTEAETLFKEHSKETAEPAEESDEKDSVESRFHRIIHQKCS